MKRKLMISVNYVLLYELPVLWILVILCVVQTVDSQQDPLECPEVTYLELGKEGIISCGFENFYSVSWFTKGDYDDKQSPFLHFNGNKHGNVDEYDVHPNGSLIFRNVSLNDAGAYTVTMLKDTTSNLLVKEVHLKVYVIPDPIYPVVEGYTSQQHVYMDVSRNGELSCSVRGVYPNISLMWTIVDRSQMGKIQFHQDVVGRRNNNDGTYDITLTSLYSMTDQSVRRITIQCGVADEMGEVLSSKTKVELLFTSVYPVVNGLINQRHVYLDANREGHLICIKENVAPGTTLAWKIDDPNMQEKITFQSNAIVLDNNDGTVTINQTFVYEIHDYLLDRITVKCEVVTPGAEETPLATRVDLFFENVYPVVNGLINQRHIYLDANREGHLICIKENVAPGTTLAWKIVDPNMQEKITFQINATVSDNNDGTVTINQEVGYKILDRSLDRVTIECEVTTPDTDENSLATKVDLLFQNVYPVVNGYVNQNRVYLDVDRIGHLSCLKENVDPDTRLEWALDSTLKGKVTFHSRAVTVINPDGTVNINQTFDYVVHDNFLERVTIECRVIKPGILEHPIATTVDLLFSSAHPSFTDPVITGCYDSPHDCTLEVQRSGKLTCTVKNSHYPVTLKWTASDTDKTHVAFKNSTIVAHNSSNLYNVRITTQYTVEDESVTTVTVQCDACIAESGQVMAMAETSLMIQTAADTERKSSHDTSHVIAVTLMFLVIMSLLLIVIIFLYCNRKMFKNSEVKYLAALGTVDRHTDNGNVEMVLTRNTDLAERGSPLSFGRNVQNGEQVPPNNQSDSFDSGTLSNSQQLNEDEADEKHAFLDGGCPNTKEQDPSDVNQRTCRDAQVV